MTRHIVSAMTFFDSLVMHRKELDWKSNQMKLFTPIHKWSVRVMTSIQDKNKCLTQKKISVMTSENTK